MKTVEAIFKHGKFYSKNEKKRILLRDSADVIIVFKEKDLIAIDPYNKSLKKNPPMEIEGWLNKRKYYKFQKVAEPHDKMNFIISAGKRNKNGDRQIICQFELELQEPLYMIWKSKSTKYGIVYDCYCIVTKALCGLEYFEPLYASSLNDAYTKTYESYFLKYGKSTINVYNNFELLKGEKSVRLSNLRLK